ncbi:hypothetical protein C474_15399 [Halogeometricum pallidum JCM 14848]|uniref:Outer membrane lipoprotein-sorting protein-like protein n=1 Tax=Halogeometricum pallidum JCM 14848 TaxID=1227487 RepID=M0D304_HALPD|nr:hypothetical protein [Halogeometricum pallidum]ELZ28504.1 hypothetical protein C474_15399 [Halogeometricum pallidum JCM 14848]
MSLQRGAGVLGLVLLVVLGGCLGGGGTPGQGATASTDAETGAPTPSSTRTTGGPSDGTPTMGEIPTPNDRTEEVLEEIRRTQADIESYRATVTERTVTQLSNGSELTRERTWYVWVKYTDEGVLARVETPRRDDPSGERRAYVRNRTASVTYDPAQDEYLIDRNGGAADADEPVNLHPHLRSDGDEYNLYEAPASVIRAENAVSYEGTETVGGEEAYVIHLDGNPNGGNRAYYDAQTLWVDIDTGLVLRQTAQKPHLDSMPNVSVSDVRNPEENSPFNDSDDGPNTVYFGDKTITTTYTNVSVDVPDDAFGPKIPAGADVENVTDERA